MMVHLVEWWFIRVVSNYYQEIGSAIYRVMDEDVVTKDYALLGSLMQLALLVKNI